MKKVLLVLLLLFNVGFCTWWNSSWTYKEQLNISNTYIDSDLTNFPILVHLNSSNFDFSKAQSNGEDIRFLNSDEDTELKYEIEKWDSSSQEAYIWVKIPFVNSSAITTFYMYYNNPSAVDNQDPINVWDANYIDVWHMIHPEFYGNITLVHKEYDVTDTGSRPHAQGVADDGTYLYFADDDNLLKLNRTDYSVILNVSNPNLNGTDIDQVNSITIKGDYLYLGANNYTGTYSPASKGYIKVFNKTDLSYVEEHQVLNYYSEGGCFHDGYFWAVYFDWGYISRYNESTWSHVDDLKLTSKSGNDDDANSQGCMWIGDYLYVSRTYTSVYTDSIDVYFWNGTKLIYLDSLAINDQSDYQGHIQGIDKDPSNDILWIAEAHDNPGEHNNLMKNNITKGAYSTKLWGTKKTLMTKTAWNMPKKENSIIGDGLKFETENYYLEDGSTIDDLISSNLTLEGWGKTANNKSMILVSKHRGGTDGEWYLAAMGGNTMRSTVLTSAGRVDTDNSFAVNDSAWHYYVGTYNGSKILSYIDGEKQTTEGSQTGETKNTAWNLRIGDYHGDGSNSWTWDGNIDEVRISNVTRSAAWIKASYYSGKDELIEKSGIEISECSNLTIAGATYTLNKNVQTTGTCFEIQADNITLDCAGHIIEGDDSGTDYGIHNNGYDNVTIKNCRITDFNRGIYFYNGAENGTIQNNIVTSNRNAIYLSSSSNNNLINNTVNSNGYYGVFLYSSTSNILIDNTAISNLLVGICLSSSSSNTIINNTLNQNRDLQIYSSSHNNKFYYNKFYGGATYYISNSGSGNTFNTTISGVAQGNYYDDISTWKIYDYDGDGYGDFGADYPYNSSQTKWSGNGVDYGPMNATVMPLKTTVPETYNSSGDSQSVFRVTDKVTIKFNSTYYNDTTRENITRIYLSIIDPLGNVRVDNSSVLQFSDDFEDDASAWDEGTDSDWVVNGGYYKYGYSGDYHEETLVKESEFANRSDVDVAVQLNVKTDAEHTSRIIVRWQDSNNYVAAYITHYYSAIGIEEISDGTRYFTEVSKPFSTNTWYDFRVSVSGNTAKVYWNGNKVVERELQYITNAGRTGLMTDASETWYDNFTIGYPESTRELITDGYRSIFNYTIPDNTSLMGDWSIHAYTDSPTQTMGNSNTFTLVIDKPLLRNLTVLGDENAGTKRQIRADVLHETPANISTVLLNVTAANGTQVVTNQEATYIDDVESGHKYEYNYTVAKRLDSEGIWNYTFWVNDTSGNTDTASSTFNVNVPSPEIGEILVLNSTGSLQTNFDFNETETIHVNITDEDGKSNITSVTLDILYPNGTIAVNNQTMTNITSITNGYTYEYNYTFSSDDIGRYPIIIYASDSDYNVSANSGSVLYWANTSYMYRQEIDLTDTFRVARTENIGLNITANKSNINCSYMYITDNTGKEVNYELISSNDLGDNLSCLIKISFITSNNTLKYFAYYNKTGIDNTKTISDTDITIKDINFNKYNASDFFASSNEHQTTYPKGMSNGDLLGDGNVKRVVVGQTSNQSTNTHSFVMIIDENGNVEFNKTFQYGSESGFYSVRVEEMDSDYVGEEIIVGGWEYGGTYNNGSLYMYSYNGTDIILRNRKSWTVNNNNSEVFAIYTANLTGDATKEIITAGKDEGTGNTSIKIWEYDGNNFNILDTTSDRLGEKREMPFALTVGDFDGDETDEIVVAGTTQISGTNCEGGLMLNATIYIYNYTSSSLKLEQGYSYHKNDLTEIFSIDKGDVNNDGIYELITSGNWYNCTSHKDIAEIRVWNYTQGNINLINSIEFPASGHSSILSIKYNDINNDNENEIVGVGFFNDGSSDLAFQVILNNSLYTLQKSYISKPKPIRDGDYFDDMTITDVNVDGIKEILSGGRYGQTEPREMFTYEREVMGVTKTYLAPETYKVDTCGILNITGETYTLHNDVSTAGTCFEIQADNITLDCAGHTITGNGTDYGVYNNGYDNVTIKNCKIINFSSGINWRLANNGTIQNNTIKSNTYSGIFLFHSLFNNVTNNTVSNNKNGIYLTSSSHFNILTNNIANSNNEYGIRLYSSSNNILTNNIVNYNEVSGFFFESNSNNSITNNTANSNTNYGVFLYSSSNNNFTNNTVNYNSGSGIHLTDSSVNNNFNHLRVCFNNQSGGDYYDIKDDEYPDNNFANSIYDTSNPDDEIYFDKIANCLCIDSCTNITEPGYYELCRSIDGSSIGSGEACIDVQADNVELNCLGYSITGGGLGSGIHINGFDYANIYDCNITNFSYGIFFQGNANNGTIQNNSANSNTYDGIYLYQSSNNSLINNIVSSNTHDGIRVVSGLNNNITKNNATLNEHGIYIYQSSNNNILTNNIANANNNYGIYIYQSSKNNTVTNNIAKLNTQYGLYLDSTSTSNTIQSNNFCTNNGSYDIYDLDNNNYSNNFCDSGRKYIDGSVNDCDKNCSVNNQPTIVSVDSKSAEDPGYCTLTTIGAVMFNVTDNDGWNDINLSACYVNFTKGSVTYQSTNCVNISNGTNWVKINCTGAKFNYTDSAGSWNIIIYVEDSLGYNDTNDSTTMIYNEATSINATASITWATLYANTENNVNNNTFIITNCANTNATINITGDNLTDGSGHYLNADKFTMSNSSTPGTGNELDLTTDSQLYPGNLTVGNEKQYWYYVDIPVGQYKATYTGIFQYMPNKY